MTKKPKLIQIKDVPYVYIDILEYHSTLEDMIKRIQNIRTLLKETIERVNNGRDKANMITPYSKYKEIRINHDCFENSLDFKIECYREQTPEEAKVEAATRRKQSAAQKTAAIRKAEEKLAAEKALYEQLKKKYEPKS